MEHNAFVYPPKIDKFIVFPCSTAYKFYDNFLFFKELDQNFAYVATDSLRAAFYVLYVKIYFISWNLLAN